MALIIYHWSMRCGALLLRGLLGLRQWRGKEDAQRLPERMGVASAPRPEGWLAWIHAASVGEAQSALILINKLQKQYTVLVTSGTVTSARYLAARLPEQAIHQYVPLDAPQWVQRFIHHWNPDLVLWMESELWPNMLTHLKEKNIPAVLVNARLSNRSFQRWRALPDAAQRLMDCFPLILAQTQEAAEKYKKLGAESVFYTDNIKYSAAPLPFDQKELSAMQQAIGKRPLWLYASTHDGEEEMAARIHQTLADDFPDLLSIIVPRHPERGPVIEKALEGMVIQRRSLDGAPPAPETQIYIADTLGELGLFYCLSPIAVIGRSLSKDGGGGHNPIEAAQMNCAVLSGPHVQYQQALFDDMARCDAALVVTDETALSQALSRLLGDTPYLIQQQNNARLYAEKKAGVIDTVMGYLQPLLSRKKAAA